MESVWFLFWWCPLLFVDCFHKLRLSGTPLEDCQAGWDLRNRMVRGYRFYTIWVCPMESYAWGIQRFSSINEVAPHYPNRTEHLNTTGITSHGTDSFRFKPITPGHPIPKILTAWFFSAGVPDRQSLWKQSTDKRGHHQKKNHMDSTRIWSIELWTILMFKLLLCCHTAAQCMERT